MYHAVALLLSHDELICTGLANTTEVEPGLKVCQALEYVWQQEIEQAPQLTQVVLQRRACSNHAPSSFNLLLVRPHMTTSSKIYIVKRTCMSMLRLVCNSSGILYPYSNYWFSAHELHYMHIAPPEAINKYGVLQVCTLL